MHIVMVVIFGLVSLGVFVAAARLVGRDVADGARVFIWVWLAASLVNGAVGVLHAGISPVNEMAAFVPIFGIPAAAAWYLARRLKSPADAAPR